MSVYLDVDESGITAREAFLRRTSAGRALLVVERIARNWLDAPGARTHNPSRQRRRHAERRARKLK